MSLLARSGGVSEQMTFTGGVAKNDAVTHFVKELVHEHYGQRTINIHTDSPSTPARSARRCSRPTVATARRPASPPPRASTRRCARMSLQPDHRRRRRCARHMRAAHLRDRTRGCVLRCPPWSASRPRPRSGRSGRGGLRAARPRQGGHPARGLARAHTLYVASTGEGDSVHFADGRLRHDHPRPRRPLPGPRGARHRRPGRALHPRLRHRRPEPRAAPPRDRPVRQRHRPVVGGAAPATWACGWR